MSTNAAPLGERIHHVNTLLAELSRAPSAIGRAFYGPPDELGNILNKYARLAEEVHRAIPHGEIAQARRHVTRPTPKATVVGIGPVFAGVGALNETVGPLFAQSECALLVTLYADVTGRLHALAAEQYTDRGEPMPDIDDVTPADLIAAVDEIYPLMHPWLEESRRVYAEAVWELNLVQNETKSPSDTRKRQAKERPLHPSEIAIVNVLRADGGLLQGWEIAEKLSTKKKKVSTDAVRQRISRMPPGWIENDRTREGYRLLRTAMV